MGDDLGSLKGNISKFFAWIMVSIVIVSLAGFGIQDVILGSSGRNIATVGKEKITVNNFLVNVESEILKFSQENNVSLTVEEAKTYGLASKALNDLIAKKIFDNLIRDEGISREDTSVAEYIRTVESFKNISGDFDVEKYKRYVATMGVTIKDFENNLKDDLVRELILNVFQAPTKIDTTILEKSIAHYFQSRSVSFIELNANTFKNLSKKPTDSEISKYFEDRKNEFKSPDKKIIKLGKLDFEKIVKEQNIENNQIKDYYENNISGFLIEEKRLIDKLVFPNESNNNKKLIEEIKLNPEAFNEEVFNRDLKIDDVTLGFVDKSKSNNNENLKDLFNKKNVGIYGPYETDLGLALYRIREISAENQTTFTDAKNEIRNLLASEKAKNKLFKLLDELNNEVAAGQTLEDLESKFSISIETIEIENDEMPNQFKDDQSARNLFENASDQITEFVMLKDNSLIAMKVDDEIKSRNLSLEEVSRDIAEILHNESTLITTKSYLENKLNQKNESFLNQLFEINSDEEILVEVKNRKIFRFNIDKQLTKELMQRIFSLKEKEFLFFFDKSKLFLAFVETINPNDIDKELKRTLMSQREQFLRISLRQNFINNFLNFIKQDTDINVNENLIESTLSNLRRNS